MNDKMEDLRLVWAALDPTDSDIHGRFSNLASYSVGWLQAGVDRDLKTHTLSFEFRSNCPEPFGKVPSGRGYTCRQALNEQGLIQRLSVIRHSDADQGIFAIFCADLWLALEAFDTGSLSGSEVLETVVARLEAWQEFMKKQKSSGLTLDEECGLIGELAVLAQLMEVGCSPDTALDAWCGPFQAIHDFDLDGDAIEVKTSRGTRHGSYTIENEHQLDSSTVRRLQLAALDLVQDEDGRSLKDWVAFVLGLMPSRLNEVLCDRLYRAGINPSAPICSDYVWRLERSRYFVVNDRFPAITPRSLPDSVNDVCYTLKPSTRENTPALPLRLDT